jgi:cyclase
MAEPSVREAALREVGDGSFAYLQGDGWGWSNAGLVTSRGEGLLVDTLFDLNLTRRMLDAMRRRTPAADHIATVVNTHANGDHCWGNQLVAGAEIVASRRAAAEMSEEASPALLKTLVRASRVALGFGGHVRRAANLLGRLGVPRAASFGDAAQLVVDKFGVFDFEGIELTLPTTTFDDRLTLRVGDKEMHLIEVGPAHTRGDTIVHVPSDRVVFTGDILFIGSHPIVWEGPVGNWIRACERILELDVDAIVPGHGPLTDKDGVRRVKEYWEYLLSASRDRFEAGMSAEEAARDIALEGFSHWLERERIAVNVDTIYRELAGDRSKRDPLAMLARMARFATPTPESPTASSRAR